MKKILFVLLLGSLTLSCQKSKENSENQATTPDSTAFTNERNTFFSNLLAPPRQQRNFRRLEQNLMPV